MPIGLTRALGMFAAELRPASIPSEAAEIACTGFTDCIATMIAGRSEAPVHAAAEVYLPVEDTGHAHIAFTGRRADAPAAAMVNGTAAHVLDFDDVAMRGHPSAVMVPALLAEAEELDCPGAALVTAYVAGFETWAELNRREPDPLHTKGWHPTAVYGTLAAAAACASLRRLDATEATHAIALAASQATGLTANFGSSSKSFHVGRAAASGLLSARLAAAGATGAEDVLENRHGFLNAFSPNGRCNRDDVTIPLGSSWRITEHRLSIKRYPVCYAAHRAIDAAIELRGKSGFDTQAIAAIHVKIGATQAGMLRVERPNNPLEAKFSIQFCLAAAFLAGNVGFAQLTDEFLTRSDVRRLIGLVKIDVDASVDPDFPNYCPFDLVTVTLADGKQFVSAPVSRAKGHGSRPLTTTELQTKFNDCIGDALAPVPRDKLFMRLQNLANVAAVRQLVDDAISSQALPDRGATKKARSGG
ncbi:MAG TPA: MmgE/PrpD family protein [Xanthobacteraceae bacterium]|nr:MmgE/PrpD family protein [Xanthobacteraceae bacterium]